MNNSTIRLGVWLLPVLALGCGITDVGNNDFEAVDSFFYDVALDQQIRIRVEGVNGSITVTGDAAVASVIVAGERRVRSESAADATEHLDDLEVVISERQTEILVQTRQPSDPRGRGYEVTYEITVPIDFDADIENVNGAIDIQFVTGEVLVDNVNGEVTLTDTAGDANIELVNGRIDAVLDPLGHPTVDLATVNGRIDVSVPGSVSCLLDAQVVNGTITVSNLNLFDVIQTNTTLEATIGGGEGRLALRTVNGDIHITGR